MQDIWTPDRPGGPGGPPALLSEGSAPELPLVGERQVGSDHRSVGKSKQVREAGPGILEKQIRTTTMYLKVPSRFLLTVPADLWMLFGRSELWREKKKKKGMKGELRKLERRIPSEGGSDAWLEGMRVTPKNWLR